MKQRGPNGQKWNQHLRRTDGVNRISTPEQDMARLAARLQYYDDVFVARQAKRLDRAAK